MVCLSSGGEWLCVCVSCHGTLNAPTIEISEMCYLMVLLVNFSVDGQNSKRDATFRRMCDVGVKHVFTGPRHNENRPKNNKNTNVNAFFDQIHEFMRQPGLNRKCIVCYFGWRKCRVNGQIIIGVMARITTRIIWTCERSESSWHSQSLLNFGRCHSLNTRTTINFFSPFLFYVLFFVLSMVLIHVFIPYFCSTTAI